MNHLVNFKKFEKTEFLGQADEPVEIRIDVEAIPHALDRQYRHGLNSIIKEEEIIDLIKKSIPEITISLMQDKFSIYQEEDDYPTKGVKAGEPNRFVIKSKETDLNIVCELKSGENEFTLTVITVMRKLSFKTYPGQFTIKV